LAGFKTSVKVVEFEVRNSPSMRSFVTGVTEGEEGGFAAVATVPAEAAEKNEAHTEDALGASAEGWRPEACRSQHP
jgi:hypothetical protein